MLKGVSGRGGGEFEGVIASEGWVGVGGWRLYVIVGQ